MNYREAGQVFEQLDTDLAAESDPELRAWYKQEYELQPDFKEASSTIHEFTLLTSSLAWQLQLLRRQKYEQDAPKIHLIQPDIEPTRILTNEEKLQQRIKRSYRQSHDEYEVTFRQLPLKKSKREHLLKLARRNFARQICDIHELTGDAHLVLQPKLLDYLLNECEDIELGDAIVASCVAYAEVHKQEIAADPKCFAYIIESATSDKDTAEDYESILRAIFSAKHSTHEFPQVLIGIAHAAFELLENDDALKRIIRIAHEDDKIVPRQFVDEIIKYTYSCVLKKELVQATEIQQALAVFESFNNPGEFDGYSPYGGGGLFQSGRLEEMRSLQARLQVEHKLTKSEIDTGFDLLPSYLNGRPRKFDPATVISLDQETTVDLHLRDEPGANEIPLQNSSLYIKRMQELAPYIYSRTAAETFFESGSRRIVIPLSPGMTLDLFIPTDSQNEPDLSLFDEPLVSIAYQQIYDVLKHIQNPRNFAAQAYQPGKELRLIHLPITYGNKVRVLYILRPSIILDRQNSDPLQLLNLHFWRAGHLRQVDDSPEYYETENDLLKAQLAEKQMRFLGRRAVQFALPKPIRRTGLRSVTLRVDQATRVLKGNLELDEGSVDLDINPDYSIVSHAKQDAQLFGPPTFKQYYENMILKLVVHWACGKEVKTSEGTVSEASGISANMGHFAYLRLGTDGKKYNFSNKQAAVYAEEQHYRRTTLAQESARLRQLDETGKERNSTYVRENYDPAKAPLAIYCGRAILGIKY